MSMNEMSEEMDDALRQYAEHVDSFRNKLEAWNEVQVKMYLVEELLNALCWKTKDPNLVDPEVPVTMGSDTRKVDYALMSEGVPICVVEAKAGELDEAAARQALSYAGALRVPWALVTNGRTLRLYGHEFYAPPENVSNALVMDVQISAESIADSLPTLKLLGRGNLGTTEVDEVFKRLNERRAMLAFLQNNKAPLVEVISRWVQEKWGKGVVHQESLLACLSCVFGKAERTEGKPDRRGTRTLRKTVASEWKHRPDIGKGVFRFKEDETKEIDVELSGRKVEEQLERLGLTAGGPSALGGFYYILRRTARLIRPR